MVIALSFLAVSAAANAMSTLINGHWTRKENRLIRAEDLAQREKDRLENRFRYAQDYDFRVGRFLWEQQQAEAALIARFEERMKDYAQQDKRDHRMMAASSLSLVFNPSMHGVYLHDPKAMASRGVKSLRVMVHISGASDMMQNLVEYHVNAAIQQYSGNDTGTPIHFTTGSWKPSAHSGSWVASELNAIEDSIPTLIIRANPISGEEYAIHADLFGFPMAGRTYQDNVIFGKLPKDMEAIGQTLALIALGSSDFYFLSNYGKIPRLPGMLSRFLPEGEQNFAADKVVSDIVQGYQATVNTLLMEKPEVGLPAALSLAQSLLALANKRYALEQVQQIEGFTTAILPKHSKLVEKLKDLYAQLDRPQDVERLSHIELQQRITPVNGKVLLEKVL